MKKSSKNLGQVVGMIDAQMTGIGYDAHICGPQKESRARYYFNEEYTFVLLAFKTNWRTHKEERRSSLLRLFDSAIHELRAKIGSSTKLLQFKDLITLI